jgi:hypothetical protein
LEVAPEEEVLFERLGFLSSVFFPTYCHPEFAGRSSSSPGKDEPQVMVLPVLTEVVGCEQECLR